VQVAIIGAGIGGLAAAIFIKKLGHTVTVFEAFPSAQPVGAGLLLQPPGQEVLKRLGVHAEALANAPAITRLHSTTKAGRKLLDLHYGGLSGPARHGYGVTRTDLHGALLAKALEEQILLELGTRIAGLGDDHIVTAAGTAGPFDLIIVATGAGSDWLDNKRFGRTAPAYPWGCMWATVPLPGSLSPDTLHQRCDAARKMVGLLPIQKTANGHNAALYWSVCNANAAGWYNAPYDAFLGELGDIWPEARDAAATVPKESFVHAIYRDIWCKRPVSGKTVLIGDAAHGTSPQLGQGASMALLDAYELAQQLERCETTERALSAFVAARRSQLRYVRYASRFLTPLFQSRSRALALMRDIFCGPATSVPGGYGLALKTLASDIFRPAIMREGQR
jgi:2-polyprenyl-6-methoxyphenol hydroxylase-like FAD-dependent oxidoreductase